MQAIQQQQTFSSFNRFRPHFQPNKRPFQPASSSRIPTFTKLRRPSLFSAALADEETSISNPTKLVEPATSTGAGKRKSETRKVSEENSNGSNSSLSALPVNGSSNSSLETFSSSSSSLSTSPSYRLVELPHELRGVKDYMNRASEIIKIIDSSPRWFCPLECGTPRQDAPLLLFLPGMDGTGLGIIRHYESLGRYVGTFNPTQHAVPYEPNLVSQAGVVLIRDCQRKLQAAFNSWGGRMGLISMFC